ncbi:MAG: hypothetical protein QF569_12575 [Candidatus Poribacteria bacterium]|nr:hypothetical protein [Candidatus Poribacteria bacterium]
MNNRQYGASLNELSSLYQMHDHILSISEPAISSGRYRFKLGVSLHCQLATPSARKLI